MFTTRVGADSAEWWEREKQLGEDIAGLKGKGDEEPPDHIDRMNERHAVVFMDGQVLIVAENNGAPHFVSSGQFHLWYANQKVEVGEEDKKRWVSISHLW